MVDESVKNCRALLKESENYKDIHEILVVFVAFRKVSLAAEDLPENVAILNHESLTALYGPSLIHRPQFLADVLGK